MFLIMKCVLSSSYEKGVVQWKRKLKSKGDRALQKILEGLEFWAAFQNLGRLVSPSLLGGIKGGSFGPLSVSPRPSHTLNLNPIRVWV